MKTKENWKPVAIGGTTGIMLGAAVTYVVKRGHSEDEDSQQADGQADADAGSAFAHVNDDMSFNEAFSAARAEMGPGGLFCWRGNVYGTYTATEWDAMTNAEKNQFASYASRAVSSEAIETNQVAEVVSEDDAPAADVQIAEANVTEEASAADVDLAEVNYNSESVAVAEEAAAEEAAAEEEVAVVTPTWDSLVSEDNDVRVVGYQDVELADGRYAPMQELDINGQRVAVIDIDGDGVADMALSDLNHNNEMDEGEVIDLQTGEIVSFTNDDSLAETAPDADLATL